MPGYWRQVGLIRLPGGRWSAERTTLSLNAAEYDERLRGPACALGMRRRNWSQFRGSSR